MKKSEFLELLKQSLNGEIRPDKIKQNIDYYDQYIGNNPSDEEEIINKLGDPRLIAKTIIESERIAKERGKFKDAVFVEAFACTEGCLGGLLLVENPYNARRVISKYRGILNYSYMEEEIIKDCREQFLADYSIIKTSSQKFSEDFHEAVSKMKHMNYILNMLPGTDCGQCGSPSCRAFAEDVTRGLSTADECKFIKMEE
jgi:iron only hydrogenase large subunit-like protein